MSSEMYVFFTGALPTKGRLQEAMAALGLHITFPDPDTALENHGGGFMPMLFQGKNKTGAEFDISESHGAVEQFGIDGVASHFDRMVSFRWSTVLMEAIVATCAAAALA